MLKKIGFFFLALVLALGIFLFIRKLQERRAIFRLSTPPPVKKTGLTYYIEREGVEIHFRIKVEGGRISIKSGSHRSVFEGYLIPEDEEGLSFTNQFCNGQCRVLFHYFQPLFSGSKGQVFFVVKRRGREILRRKLRGFNSVQLFSAVLSLRKGDELLIEKRGNSFAIVGRPVLSAVEEPSPVFLIGVDTLRRDSLGIYNPGKKCSPNIDEFAKDSVVFKNAFSVSSWTLPSFSSVFTGLYPRHHGANYESSFLPRGKMLTPEIQREYYTYAITGDFFVSSRQNFYYGFDYFEECSDDPNISHAAKVLFEKAEKAMEKLPAKTFFFLHTYQLHLPYYPEKSLADEYYRLIGFKNGIYYLKFLDIRGNSIPKFQISPEERPRAFRNLYEAGVYTFDRRFGQFIEFLKRKGIYHRALIILFSDHGEEFEEHGGWTHGHTLYNELIRVPLLVKLPGEKHGGKVIEENVSLVDILPTVLDLLHIRINKKLDGKNIFKNKGKRRLLKAYLAPEGIRKGVGGKIAYIYGKYKIIRNQPMATEGGKFPSLIEVYNMENDPWERVNLFRKTRDRSPIRLVKLIYREKFTHKKSGQKLPEEIYKKLKTLGYN